MAITRIFDENGVQIDSHNADVDIKMLESDTLGVRVLGNDGSVLHQHFGDVDVNFVAIPEPPPPPPPPPPPTEPKPDDMVRVFNVGTGITFAENTTGGNAYLRYQKLPRWSGDSVVQRIHRKKTNAFNYTLTIDGVSVATIAIGANVTFGDFTVDTTALAEGWHVLDVLGQTDETCNFMPVYLLKGATAQPHDWFPVFSGNDEYGRLSDLNVRINWAPTRYTPTVVNAPSRTYEPFDTTIHRSGLFREILCPPHQGNVYRPNLSQEGIWNACNKQLYTWWDFVRSKPINALLDGPRGTGTMGYTSHIDIGTAVVNGVTMHNLYVLDPWRVCKVFEDGTIKTLAGYRHPSVGHYWEDPDNVELVGNWSAIPVERHGFHELWGMAWNPASLGVDANGNHTRGPQMFVADPQKNRVCRLEFDPNSHATPVIVTEFLTGLGDPWDCVSWGGSLIVSERSSHRIAQYNIETGAFQRVIVQGAALAVIGSDRLMHRAAPVATLRAEDVVAPEGLYIMDDWLYYGSISMAQVKRVHLVTGAIEVVVPSHGATFANLNFIKLAVSDGTFGPRHTVFVTSWIVSGYGGPIAYPPGGSGSQWELMLSGLSTGIPRGKGGDWDSTSYNGAVGCRNGKLAYGGAGEALILMSKAQPSDPTADRTLYNSGKQRWKSDGLKFIYGDYGFGFFGEELPWGHSPETDYYLSWNGHVPPPV